jgi:O-antigen ligase
VRDLIIEKGPPFRRAVLLGLVGAVPLLFLRTENDPFNVPKFAFLAIGVAIAAASRGIELLQGVSAQGLKRLWIPATAVAAPLLLAWSFSPYRAFALFGRQGRLQGLIPYLIVVLFGVLLADAFRDRPRPLLWAIAISGYASGAYSLIQFLQADPYGWLLFGGKSSSAVSTLGNPNFTGGFLAMVLPVSVVLWVTTPKHRKPLGFLIAAVFGGWVFANSQGGWLAGVAGLGVVAGTIVAKNSPRARWLGLGVAVGMAAIAVGVVVAGLLGVDRVPATATSRGYWWQAATRMAMDSPVVGKGPNTFSVEGVHYRDERESVISGYTFPDDPHSIPFAYLANAGALGLIGFAVMAIWGIKRGLSFPVANLEAAAFLGVVVAYLVQALVTIDELTLRTTFWTGLAGLAVTMPIAKSKGATKTGAPERARKRARARTARPVRLWPVAIVIGLAAVSAVWWSVQFVIADARVNAAAKFLEEGRLDEGVGEFDKAFDFRDDVFYRRIYASSLANLADKTQDPRLFELADGAFDSFARWPDVQVIVQHARLMQLWSALDPTRGVEWVALLRDAMAIDPANPVIRIELSDALIAAGEPSEAVTVLEPSIPIVSTLTDSSSEFWGALALARAKDGDEAGARDALELALLYDPSDLRALEAQQLLDRRA